MNTLPVTPSQALPTNLYRRIGKLKFSVLCVCTAALLFVSCCIDDIHHLTSIMTIIKGGFLPDNLSRIIICLIAGGCMALAGTSYQSVFKNPLVSPGILGVLDGTSVGFTAYMFLSPFNRYETGAPYLLFIYISGFGAFLAVLGVTHLTRKISGGSVLDLLLVGMILSAFFDSVYWLITRISLAVSSNGAGEQAFMQIQAFQQMHYTYAATAQSSNRMLILLFVLVACCLPLWLMRFQLNLLSFGEEEAGALGLNVRLTKIIVLFCSTVLTITVVAFCGKLSWIGFIAPNICRTLFGPDTRRLVPSSLLLGGLLFNFFTDTSILTSVPLPIITAVIGAVMFLSILKKSRRGWL